MRVKAVAGLNRRGRAGLKSSQNVINVDSCASIKFVLCAKAAHVIAEIDISTA